MALLIIASRARLGYFSMPMRTACLALLAACAPDRVAAYTTESPAVLRMVQRGVEFLSSSAVDARLGGRALVGLVLLKQNLNPHDLVSEAVMACEEACSRPVKEMDEDIYSTGLAIVFLCELDSVKYRKHIGMLVESLLLRQRSDGAWGYPSDTLSGRTGDTSMTQYGVLGLWTAQQNGFRVPAAAFVNATNWLLRTQDPQGGWGYHPRDPGAGNFQRSSQRDVRHSLCAAGVGSLYICQNALGGSWRRQGESRAEGNLPAALKLVGAQRAPQPTAATSRVDGRRWRNAVRDARTWFRQNSYQPSRAWPIYYLYALERYQAFLELVEPKAKMDWYDVGVEHLNRKQQSDGSWMGQGGREVSTAFAILFLTRSTRQAIRKSDYGEGRLIGGRGLPQSVAHVRIKKGRIVSTSLGISPEEALEALENSHDKEFASLAGVDETFKLSDDSSERTLQLDRLRQIAKSGTAEARAIAIRHLSAERNLDDVPLFLAALWDASAQVRQSADAALRRVSRKIDGVELPGSPLSAAARKHAWEQWFLTIRPNRKPL